MSVSRLEGQAEPRSLPLQLLRSPTRSFGAAVGSWEACGSPNCGLVSHLIKSHLHIPCILRGKDLGFRCEPSLLLFPLAGSSLVSNVTSLHSPSTVSSYELSYDNGRLRRMTWRLQKVTPWMPRTSGCPEWVVWWPRLG